MTTELDPTHLARVLEAARTVETIRAETDKEGWREIANEEITAMRHFQRLCTPTFIRALVERVQELEKDRERLDWVEHAEPDICAFVDDDGEDGWNVGKGEGGTIREAIDAAREREGGS